jgi:hypothetical protein
MKSVELYTQVRRAVYTQVRRAVYVEGISQREAARRFGIDPERYRRCWRSRCRQCLFVIGAERHAPAFAQQQCAIIGRKQPIYP